MPAVLPRAITSEADAWAVLERVPDPEVPVVSVVELGIVRGVELGDDGSVTVTVTPTYSGCPATEAIEHDIVEALRGAGAGPVQVRRQLAPAWTTDWLQPAAREKLRRHGIAPPACSAGGDGVAPQPLRFFPHAIACPRCGSRRVEQLSAFGSTACKALYRCSGCGEPFDYFKPI